MARYLSNIDLSNNQLQNAALHPTASAPSNPVEGQVYYNTTTDDLFVFNGTSWVSVSGTATIVTAGAGLTSTGTTGDITLNVGAGNGIIANADDIALNIETTQFEFVTGKLTISNGAIGPDELAATTVTAGSYGSATAIPTFTVDADGRLTAAGTAAVSSNLGIAGDTGTDTVSLLTDTLTFSGTTNEIVTAVTDNTVTISLPDDITIGNNLIVSGNLTVSGTTTTVNTETINLADNIITLNSNYAGSAPSENAGIEVERGTVDASVSLVWNESTDRWTFTNDGTTFYNIPISTEYSNYSFSISDGGTTETIADGNTVTFAAGTGASVAVSATDTVTYSHADTSSVANVDNSGLTVVQDLTFDGFGHVQTVGSSDITSAVDGRITAREYVTSIGDGTTTAYTVTHSLNSRDVIVQLFDNSSFDTVFADVERTTLDTLTVTFAAAPSLNDIRVLVTKIG